MTDANATVIAAGIAGVASIIVALITVLRVRKKKPGDQGRSISNTNITAGGNAFVAAGDVHVQYLQERFISRTGGHLIIAVSKTVIPNEVLRQKWSSFDAKFLKECVQDTPRGEVFDSEAFQAYKTARGEPVEPRTKRSLDISAICRLPFDKPVLSAVEGLRANGRLNQSIPNTLVSPAAQRRCVGESCVRRENDKKLHIAA